MLAKEGIGQLADPWDADPGSPGKARGTPGGHEQVLALRWEPAQRGARHLSLENRGVLLARQTKDSDSWLLVAAHHDDG